MKNLSDRAADDKSISAALRGLKNGLSMPELTTKTGIETRAARRSLYRLRDAKAVRAVGVKKACRYYAAGAVPKAAAKKAPAKKSAAAKKKPAKKSAAKKYGTREPSFTRVC